MLHASQNIHSLVSLPSVPQLQLAISCSHYATVTTAQFNMNAPYSNQFRVYVYSSSVASLRIKLKINNDFFTFYGNIEDFWTINPLNPELNPICYLLALLGAHHFLYVSRIRVKLLTLRLLMSYIYIYGAPILDVSRSHTTTQHSR